MKVTLKDIANDTGYSVSTVSRVLNGSNKISASTKNEILESAQKFDYQTPKVRNAQTSTRLLNVALIASGFHEGEFYTSFFNGLNQAAHDNNIRLFLTGIRDPKEETPKIIREITTNYYDGAILFLPEYKRRDYKVLEDLIPSNFPIISNALIENPVFATITFDSYSGGHLAAIHFEEKEHQQVGIIKGPFERAESRFRYNGFADYIHQHETMKLTWSHEGDFTFESGHDAFEAYQSLSEKPTAVFASNDDMCNGFMEAAISKNYRFPSDVAVIGYDDLPVSRHNRPTMSSIRTNYTKLGEATMKLLREKLSNPKQSDNMLSFVPVTVIERDSS